MTRPARERLEALRHAMEQAAAEGDFEEAARLRDSLSLLRGSAENASPDIDTSGLVRQQPGSMGLGTSQQRLTPPPGWKPPPRPDLMTKGRRRPRRSR